MALTGNRTQTMGRELDHSLAILSGEAAHQRIKHPEPHKGSTALAVWEKVPSQPGLFVNGYYDVPLLKEPVWIWSVPVYFYIGGVAGGSAVLSALLQGKRPLKDLAAACRWLAFLGTTVGPGLLTWDLGRRLRFAKMLRVFRPTSPMSVGSWSLAGSGLLATLVLLQGYRRSAGPAAWGLAGGGILLAGYTGVLLANTANPVWQESRITLPILFTASAMASTSGLLEMLPLNKREEAVVNRFGIIGKIAEAISMTAMERETSVPELKSRFKKGTGGFLWQSAKGLLAAGIAVSLFPGDSVSKRRTGAALTTVGALCLRFALLQMGKEAAAEPRLVAAVQRNA